MGVNRHDTHPQRMYVSVEDMSGIFCFLSNSTAMPFALRTIPDPVYLQLCDIYGLYVIDEAI